MIAHCYKGTANQAYTAVRHGRKVICLYHINCFDGLGAAWAVSHWLSKMTEHEVIFHPVDYRDPVPMDVTGAVVFVVDFSYDLEVMKDLYNKCAHLVFLDHHDRSKRIVTDLCTWIGTRGEEMKPYYFEYDAEHSGAVMTWRYLFPDLDTPAILRHIGDRDLWKFELPETRAVMEGVGRWGMNLLTWSKKLRDQDAAVKECYQYGKPLVEKLDADVENVIRMTHRYVNIFGETVSMINVPKFLTSEAVGKLAARVPTGYAIGYYDDATHRVFSLRSAKGTGTNVRLLAERFGGGGHDNAAGFTVTRDHPLAQI